MDEKKYHIDGEPASARDIITRAAGLDGYFANDWCKKTSIAAEILRKHGHTVGDAPKEK